MHHEAALGAVGSPHTHKHTKHTTLTLEVQGAAVGCTKRFSCRRANTHARRRSSAVRLLLLQEEKSVTYIYLIPLSRRIFVFGLIWGLWCKGVITRHKLLAF